MKEQQKLFGGKAEIIEAKRPRPRQPIVYHQGKPLIDPEARDKTPSDEYLERIMNAMYLWDMRCWDERSRGEAEKWVRFIKEGGRDDKNCGHAAYCIGKLLRRGVNESDIVDAIMANDQIQFRNRLVRCFSGIVTEDFSSHPCPRAREAKGYHKSNCGDCEDPKDEARNKNRREYKRLARKAEGSGAGEQQQETA